MTDTTTDAGPVAHSDHAKVRSLTLRGLLLQGAFNYERFQNLGFWWMLRPTLDRLYPDKQDRAAAYQRHMAYFNTNAWVIGPIAGVVTAMEEQRSKGATEFDDEAINSVKVGLMPRWPGSVIRWCSARSAPSSRRCAPRWPSPATSPLPSFSS